MKKLYHYTPMLILALLSAVVMIVAEVLVFCNTMVFNPDYYVWVISENDVDDAVYDELDKYFGQMPQSTGIPKSVYVKSLDKKKVSAATKQLAKASFDYIFGRTTKKPELKYDHTQYEIDVTEYCETYSQEHDIVKDSDYYSMLDNTLYVTEKKVDRTLDVFLSQQLAENSMVRYTRRFVPSVRVFVGISFVMLAMFLGLMYYIDRNHPCDLLYWLGTVLFSGSAVLLIPTAYARLTGYFDGFFMEDETIYYAMTGAIYGITDRVMLVNAGLFAFGIILMIFAQVIHVFRVREAKHAVREEAEDEEED